ncbi:uncharacterized protein A1O5_03032 [Cladophialophora psammophila CBS 110553]|uniref:Nephrocystin 3-like N-terminal domain-containing protein n=1 Tax=Cladophialophora psammophila CBS 110553 TaxID=1182543 RepID=W9WYI2_9EURO|nr:uncharacterized protein A1O5_03032 [Cladophialophora psammophila CBS 110553]EXJ73272.1 hypothetical protein A1O5_03032 [Cladophialophora psammophila CBS 110553]
MASRCRRPTYRVRQIPAHCAQFDEVARILSYVLDYRKGITVRSLASSIDSFESPPTKVATVAFEDLPQALHDAKDPGRSEWSFGNKIFSHNLIIDTHFQGFTVLNEVDVDHHLVDCIAISGLAGHAFGSWCAQDRSVDFMWPRDALPKRYPRMRVLMYGYDSRLPNSASFQSIPDISLGLVAKLRSVGLAEPSTKPILFLAHSLGGIVVKEALAQIANSSLEETWMPKFKCAIFFGVPNRGMKISHLLPMVQHQPNEPLVKSLAEGSPYLEGLDAQFCGISSMRNIEIVSIYETQKSLTPKLLSNGQWKKDGPHEILVQLDSAIQRGTRPENKYPVDKDHSSLVKFNETEADLSAVLFFMRSLYHTLQRRSDGITVGQHVNVLPQHDPATAQASETAMPSNYLAHDQKQRIRTQPFPFAFPYCAYLHAVQSVLDSIFLEDTVYRYSVVEKAHETTLDWIFLKPDLGMMHWLQWGRGIFWISGKPGSGKSTAMKHIYQRHVGSQRSPSNTITPQEVVAQFFFFQRGSIIQKSFEGLLRSLLHQILSKIGLLTEKIFSEWFEPNVNNVQRWSLNSLDRVWDRLIEQKCVPLNIILFLDALDEFDGPAEKVAMFVKRTARGSPGSQTRIRICCASRPWDVFSDHFKSCQTFNMEDHTEADIRRYVIDTISTHEAMKPWFQSTIQAERQPIYDLISEILQQAQGVFIWVKLVLQDLLESRTGGADIDELRQTIRSLPHELEDLYQALMGRIQKPGFSEETYAMLEILVRSPEPLELRQFVCILRCATASNLEHGVQRLQQLGQELSSSEVDTFRRRLRSHCGGLVEIVARRQETNTSRNQLYNAPEVNVLAHDSLGTRATSATGEKRKEFATCTRPSNSPHVRTTTSKSDALMPSITHLPSKIPPASPQPLQHLGAAHIRSPFKPLGPPFPPSSGGPPCPPSQTYPFCPAVPSGNLVSGLSPPGHVQWVGEPNKEPNHGFPLHASFPINASASTGTLPNTCGHGYYLPAPVNLVPNPCGHGYYLPAPVNLVPNPCGHGYYLPAPVNLVPNSCGHGYYYLPAPVNLVPNPCGHGHCLPAPIWSTVPPSHCGYHPSRPYARLGTGQSINGIQHAQRSNSMREHEQGLEQGLDQARGYPPEVHHSPVGGQQNEEPHLPCMRSSGPLLTQDLSHSNRDIQAYEKDPVYIVQLMHQTVKDFVTRPGFKASLSIDRNFTKYENGHSFFAKFGLTLIASSVETTQAHSNSRIPWLTKIIADNLFSLCANSFHNAERTTGFSQSGLLDSIDDAQFQSFFSQQRYDDDEEYRALNDYRPRRWPIDSRLSFAAILRMPIYLRSRLLQNSAAPASGKVPILHSIVEKFHHSQCFNPVQVTKMMLQHGASVHDTFENLTVFQSLFRIIDPTIDPVPYSSYFGQLAKLLLENGSDPNCDIFYLADNLEWFRDDPEAYTSKVLHLVLGSSDMVRLLLEHGADVNGRNGQGETPLDVMVRWSAEFCVNGYGTDDEQLKSAIALIKAGAKVTMRSFKWKMFPREQNEDEDEDEDEDDSTHEEASAVQKTAAGEQHDSGAQERQTEKQVLQSENMAINGGPPSIDGTTQSDVAILRSRHFVRKRDIEFLMEELESCDDGLKIRDVVAELLLRDTPTPEQRAETYPRLGITAWQ